MWEAGAETVACTIAGMRGDIETAVAAAEKAEQFGLTAGVHWTVALAQAGRSLAALAMGRHEEAYESARRLFDPDDAAYHPVMSAWVIGELAEAGLVGANRRVNDLGRGDTTLHGLVGGR